MFGFSGLISVIVAFLAGGIVAVVSPKAYAWLGKQVASAEAKAKINTTTLDARLAVLEAQLKAKGL